MTHRHTHTHIEAQFHFGLFFHKNYYITLHYCSKHSAVQLSINVNENTEPE